MLIGAYAALVILGAAGFATAFVLFGGWRVLDSLPEWLEWTVWILIAILVALVAAAWLHKVLWPERYERMKAENAQRRGGTK